MTTQSCRSSSRCSLQTDVAEQRCVTWRHQRRDASDAQALCVCARVRVRVHAQGWIIVLFAKQYLGLSNNSHIRKCLTRDVSCYPKALINWKQFIPFSEKIWSATNTCLLPNKVKEIHFKISHSYCPRNTFINTFRKDISPKCSFCNLENETRKHLFCNCKDSEDFWKKVSMLVSDIFYKIIKIDESMILEL